MVAIHSTQDDSYPSPIGNNNVSGNGIYANGTTSENIHSNGTMNGQAAQNGIIQNDESSFSPVAICGMACRLPGGIASPEQLWEFLLEGGDARTRVPKSRFNIDAYHSSTKKPGATITEYGYFLDEEVDIGTLDISFFSMPRNEVARLDPQQRLLLEVARESIDDAGEVGWKGSNIGVYVGTFSQDWYDAYNKDSSKYGIYQATATHDFMVSERLSHEMDLRGPSMTIRTACSSAFVGLNEACMSIARGDCKSAIVGGSSIIMAPSLMAAMSEQGVLSPDGSCKTFSAAANGYARGEAIVSFYVKSMDAAIADGNPIRAVIAGTSTNFDGKTPTLSMPNPEAQEALIRRAYKVAGISDFAKTGFFECHGTGTSAGDLVETSAVAAVFGQEGVHIGSVKPNLGHSEGASGLTSLLKAVLALEHKIIPPNIKSLPLNPKIPFEDKKLTVPHEAKDWPADRDERVSINSFGVGGANAHVIVESAARYRPNPNLAPPLHGIRASDSKPQLMVYSANTAQSLKDLVQIHRSFLGKTELDYEDIALTLATRREHLGHRSFAVVTKDTFDASVELPVQDAGKAGQAAPSLVMVFTGQGAAWPRFGRELLLTNPTFASSFKSLDAQLQTLGKIAPSWSLVNELCKPAKTSRVYEAEFSQPLCTAVQIALVDLLASLGVKPAAVVGHSSGEIAAAYAAGGLTAYEAIVAAFLRGATTKVQTQQGGMAAVGLGWEVAKKHLVSGVVIACDNAPNSVTLSGDADKLEQVVAAVKEAHPNVPATVLKVEKAYHSHHMELLGADYQQSMEDAGIVGRQPVIPFFSSMTGKRFGLDSKDRFGPSYWRANLEKPVLFRSAVAGIVHYPEMENELFLELGPHSALAGPLRQILTHNGSKAPYVASLVRNQHSVESFLTALGKLFTHHVDVNFTTLFPRGSAVSDMPRYPWDHQRRYWHESRVSKEWRWREHPHHDLLGIRVPECTDLEPVWRNLLHIENVPWVADHRLNDGIVFPFAAYVGMAAEAARQMSGLQDGVSLRHVIVSNALLINDEAPTELVTTLRPHKLTDSLNSEFWWDFTIASHNGHVWTKHCSGEVRGESLKEVAASKVQDLPRKVDMGRWQDALRKAGLNYGPLFTTLQDVKCTTDADDLSATGWMENNRWGQESQYHLHPVILDSYFQLLSVARANGVAHTYRRLIAASVESLTLYRNSAAELSLAATTVSTEDGLIGHGECVADHGQAVLITSGVRISLFEEGEVGEDNAMPLTARVEWVPHIDFQKTQDLIQHSIIQNDAVPILTELAQTAINLSQVLIKDIEASTPALQKYKSWLLQQCTVDSLHDLDVAASFQKMQSLRHRLQGTSAAHASDAINTVLNNIELILRGEKSGFEVLNANGDLENFMTFLQECDDARYIATLAQTKPNLKVLELEAGLGAKTRSILQSLTRSNGQILYSHYVFADASSGIINSAKESFKGTPNLEFVAWGVNQDAADTGFEPGQFDLIIASGVINTTSSLQESLRNIHQLLAPEGRLLLQEPAPGLAWTKFILGALPSFWSFDLDGRAEEPFISQPRWEEELKIAGFGDIEGITSNSKTASTIIVAKSQPKAAAAKKITLLTNGNPPTSIINGLEGRGYEINQCTLYQTPPPGQDVLAVLDQDAPFFDNINEDRFIQFKAFVKGLNGAGLLWLTKLCSVGCQDPRYGPVVGLARTLRSEMDISFAVCEAESMESSSDLDSLAAILEKFQGRSQDGPMNPDYEYAIYKGDVLSSRIFPFALDDEQTASPDSDSEATLSIAQQGRLDSLCWAGTTVEGPKEDEVEVEVYASGLNFRDVLVAMGIIDRRIPTFGYEAAGVVRRVGPKAAKLKVGDRAVFMGTKTFSTVVTAPEVLYEKMPDSMSFSEGASMPLVFATAIYSLIDIGQLCQGQSVLIHSGCGGVGLAAIQIAQMVGAQVFATVSSEEKVKYLMDTYGIPRNNIFQSRNTSFVEDLLRETDGKGVDLALNSLSGEQLHATWKCIAKWGKLVEIGKRDLLGAAKLDMTPFLDNRSYCCVDLDQMSRERPHIVSRLLSNMMDFFRQGHVKPIRIEQIASAASVQDTFRFMQQGKHIGKIILQLRDDTGTLELGEVNGVQTGGMFLDSSASYLLIGGLGGLGRAISVWLVSHGAKNLTFMSRSAGKSHRDLDFAREIQSMGCTVQLVRGDVTNVDDVARVVDGVVAPLKGIIQMSMVLRDQMFEGMSIQDWDDVNRPKVQGTWNLHTLTASRNIELDMFVLFSSLSGIVGQTGQANYAAANTFLDSFVQYRVNQGLACTAIDLGAMEGVGYLSENTELLRKMQGTGWRVVQEAQLLRGLEASMRTSLSRRAHASQCNFLLGISPSVPLSSPDSNSRLRRDARMAVYHNTSSNSKTGSGGDDGLRSFLKSVKSDPNVLRSVESTTFLALEIGKKLFNLLLRADDEEINIKMNTADIGLDSLVAVELRGWWKLSFGFDIAVLEMLGMGTLEALGKFAAERLLVLLDG